MAQLNATNPVDHNLDRLVAMFDFDMFASPNFGRFGECDPSPTCTHPPLTLSFATLPHLLEACIHVCASCLHSGRKKIAVKGWYFIKAFAA